jgi:nicotinate-nucleotide--dimethylbenzimidazole phosphoribosyltransferase
MRKAAAIRDGLFRARDWRPDSSVLLQRVGGADLAAMAGFLSRAARRGVPVLLDGVVVTAAALVAERMAPGARAWWLAGHMSAEPAHRIALEHLDLIPIVELQMRLGEGSGALTALPIVQAALATASHMATFAEAGVADGSAGPDGTDEGSQQPGSTEQASVSGDG